MAVVLQKMTRLEAAARLREMPVGIIPIGSTEQHGPHLPLGTDIYLAEELAYRISDATGAVVMPSLNFGYSWGWRDIPGTLWLPEKLLEEVLQALVRSVERYGVKVLVFLNGHEANGSAMKYAIRGIQDDVHVKVLGAFYPGLGEVYAKNMESPMWGGMFHADEFETSLMLASRRGGLVQMDKAVREYPEKPALYGTDDSSIGEISASGVYGDATLASAEKGEAMMCEFVARTSALIAAALRQVQP